MRVAVDANSLAWGWSGIPKYVDRIARELVRVGVEVDLLANAAHDFADVPGARLVRRRIRGTTLWRHAFVLPFLARTKPDVFWAPEGLAPRWTPVPLVVTVHDLAAAFLPGIKPPRERRRHATSLPRSARRADRVIAVSETTARDLRERWAVRAEAIRVVPNGIDDRFQPGDLAAAAEAVRRRWGVEGPFALAVATLEPRKGLGVLIDAARRSDVRFVFAGGTGFRGGEIAEAARAAGVQLLGPVGDDELVDLYRAADVLVAPSLYEGFGVTPLEAMASGTPAVVAAGAGALEEVAGPAAVVVAERTPDAWLAAIAEAKARRAELAVRGRALAARYRWPEVAAQVRAVLEEAASLRR